tara:strand:- start:2520 stop:2654 length:135 start_codon:yes stop_codon:yes gene_type:complete
MDQIVEKFKKEIPELRNNTDEEVREMIEAVEKAYNQVMEEKKQK